MNLVPLESSVRRSGHRLQVLVIFACFDPISVLRLKCITITNKPRPSIFTYSYFKMSLDSLGSQLSKDTKSSKSVKYWPRSGPCYGLTKVVYRFDLFIRYRYNHKQTGVQSLGRQPVFHVVMVLVLSPVVLTGRGRARIILKYIWHRKSEKMHLDTCFMCI